MALGHIFPLKYREGGVLKRAGHTEASVDLAVLAGLEPLAVLCEELGDGGSMAKRDRANGSEAGTVRGAAARARRGGGFSLLLLSKERWYLASQNDPQQAFVSIPEAVESRTSAKESYGLIIADRVPLVTPITKENKRYLQTKRSKMWHIYGAEVNGHFFSNLISKNGEPSSTVSSDPAVSDS
ncbi:hypothetical protein NL676_039235 [Syzygium grande]|nr:hypothetical protein NL676_039235 [Syzygium grande]